MEFLLTLIKVGSVSKLWFGNAFDFDCHAGLHPGEFLITFLKPQRIYQNICYDWQLNDSSSKSQFAIMYLNQSWCLILDYWCPYVGEELGHFWQFKPEMWWTWILYHQKPFLWYCLTKFLNTILLRGSKRLFHNDYPLEKTQSHGILPKLEE